MTNTNQIFADVARDSALALMNVDAFSPQALHFVEAMTDAAWKCAASTAGVLMPSATTIAAIEDLYRKRVEIRVALSRIA